MSVRTPIVFCGFMIVCVFSLYCFNVGTILPEAGKSGKREGMMLDIVLFPGILVLVIRHLSL